MIWKHSKTVETRKKVYTLSKQAYDKTLKLVSAKKFKIKTKKIERNLFSNKNCDLPFREHYFHYEFWCFENMNGRVKNEEINK